MYQDYKGFAHADINKHSNGSGYSSLEEYAKAKLKDLKYSKFIGLNINMLASKKFSIYFVVKDCEGNIVKHELKEVEESIFREVFSRLEIMIYDRSVAPIKELEDVYILETIPIKD